MIEPAAIAAQNRGNFPAAAALWQQILDNDPEDATALFNRAECLRALGRYDEAAPLFALCTEIAPRDARCWLKYGGSLLQDRQHDGAAAAIRRALELNPADADVQHAAASIASVFGDDDAALGHYRAARILNPANANHETGEAFTLWRMGRWLEAYPHYEARRHLGVASDLVPGCGPLWLGQFPIEGRRILIRTEQGFGDSLQFVRYVPMVRALGAHAVLETHTGLLRLFEGIADEQVWRGNLIEPTDCQTSLMSLPMAFRTTPETVPPPCRFATPDTVNLSAPLLKVGLCWAGGSRPLEAEAHATDKRRSIRLDMLAPVLAVPGVWFISLQVGDGADQTDPRVTVLDPPRDFATTAARIRALDLVIAVDTSVAHLAASLGVPTWLLNRFDSCWRWGLSGETTPWYASMRIFRQPSVGAWGPVVERVAGELRDLAAAS